MDGYEVTCKRRLHEQENNAKHLTIVALTAHLGDEYQQKAYESGMDDYLHKPLNWERLAGKIKEVYNQKLSLRN